MQRGASKNDNESKGRGARQVAARVGRASDQQPAVGQTVGLEAGHSHIRALRSMSERDCTRSPVSPRLGYVQAVRRARMADAAAPAQTILCARKVQEARHRTIIE